MAIPVYLQSFKAAGIYRVVFDKSTIVNVDTEILRLVVGYSEQGPFNTPVYVKDPAEFKLLFGNISKKLEKRGIYFHRLALQMLNAGPILCLNLKKFDGETVSGSTISTDFDGKFDPIDTVHLNVEDIYDTTRFWELNANKLNGLRSVEGKVLDKYINIAATNTNKKSITYFIRKAAGSKVAGYNITVNDWYSDRQEEIPEFLENQKQALISDFFAEIYVFKGKFDKKQILSSETLKNYFTIDTVDDKEILKLKSKVFNAWGEPVDTLDALYADETSGALGHYVGTLIPFFKNKQGAYISLDIAFNNDQDVHNAMLSFNTDLLDEENININLSGKNNIPSDKAKLKEIKSGTYKTKLLGNIQSPLINDTIEFGASVIKNNKPITDFYYDNNNVFGTLYITNIDTSKFELTVQQVIPVNKNINFATVKKEEQVIFKFNDKEDLEKCLNKFGIKETENGWNGDAYFDDTKVCPFFNKDENDFTETLQGPLKVITSISNLMGIEFTDKSKDTGSVPVYKFGKLSAGAIETEDSTLDTKKAITNESATDEETTVVITEDVNEALLNFNIVFMNVDVKTISKLNGNIKDSVYGSSLSFINMGTYTATKLEINDVEINCLYCYADGGDNSYEWDKSLLAVLQKGDCLLSVNDYDKDGYLDNIFVQSTGIGYDSGNRKVYYVELSDLPYQYNDDEKTDKYIIRMDSSINQEIGIMTPYYLEGYTYKNANPASTNMWAKVEWQKFILSTLTDYRGLRTALLNKAEIDYRYVVDTFESFPVANLKSVLSYLCKEKQSAFCIANFPSVKTFVKCPYTSFTDSKGIFNVEYVVKGYNKKKSAGERFSIPADIDGASFIAFYTPLKFSDGYIDTIVPAAGLVSNLFIQKYMSRQPYYIVAGPNYGNITAPGLVGPDYKYSMDELQIIEPFGVNCMVYRPNFGTFINANQTAKQIPLSALSKVNVRELVIYLQDEVEKVLQSYQWEFNNPVTRNAILDKVNYICELIKANGGIQAYKNIMDESNNTPEIIDNEMAILSTHIEPGMGCGKMVHELTLYRTGHMKAEIQD